MNNLDHTPIFDIHRGHMRFATYASENPESDDVLFVFQCSEKEAKVGEVLTMEARASEKCTNVVGIVIHGKDCAETIAEVIGSAYDKIEQRRKKLNKEVNGNDFTETDAKDPQGSGEKLGENLSPEVDDR